MELLSCCPLCEGEALSSNHFSTDYLVSKRDFKIDKCLKCGFLFTNPRPYSDQMSEYYHSVDYVSHHDTRNDLISKLYRSARKFMLNRKFNIVRKHLTQGSAMYDILDYGCGTGAFLKYCKEKDLIVQGYEPGEHALKIARHKNLMVSDEKDFKWAGCSNYNAITLWHVLEHVPDLRQTIGFFHRILSDNGILIIAVPESSSFDGRFYKNKWAAWDVPRHLYHFNENTLNGFISSGGFELIEKYPLVFDSYYISMLSESSKFMYIRAAMIGLVSNIVARIGYMPFSSQIYVFRKA
jgi:SAM-dependent methyltransferase